MDNKTYRELCITTHIAQNPAKAGGSRDFHHCNLARCISGSRKEPAAPQDQGHVNSSSQTPRVWQVAKLAPQPRWPCSGKGRRRVSAQRAVMRINKACEDAL